MKIPFNKKWFLIEKEDYANYLFVVINWQEFSILPKSWGLTGGGLLGAEYINSACNLFILKDDYDNANKSNFNSFFNKPEKWEKLFKLNKRNSDRLFSLARKIKTLPVKKLSNKQLLKWIDLFQAGQASVHVPRVVMWLLETPNTILSNYLQNYLAEKIETRKKVKSTPVEAFQVLTTPLKESLWAKEKEELAKIGLIKNKVKQQQKLFLHTKKYEWLEYGMQGKTLDINYFEKGLLKIKRQGPAKVLQKLNQEITSLVKKRKQVINEYRLHVKHKRIFRIIQESFYTRLYSKDAQFFGYYCLEGLLKEVGRRTGLTLEQVRFLAPEDYKKALIWGKDFSEITNQRQKYSLHFSYGNKTVFYLGKEAKKIRKKLKFYTEKVGQHVSDVIKGQPAYNGKVRGKVKIINTVPEMVKMHAGNILVSHMTNPGIVPVMKQAAAIITDLGGITCHAAIVARELKKPCVIGTKSATKVLKDGDVVEVDATKGTVRKV